MFSVSTGSHKCMLCALSVLREYIVYCMELGMDCGNRAGKLLPVGDEDETQLRHGCRHLSLRPLLASCTQQERHVHVCYLSQFACAVHGRDS